MKEPKTIEIVTDDGIPWFSRITRRVKFPDQDEPQLYYSLKPPDYVTALARTEQGSFVVLRQYRPILEDYTLELVSGHRENGETPEQAIIRELEEETGCRDPLVELLGELTPDTGRLENRLWAFYAPNLRLEKLPDPRQNEGIEVRLVSPAQLRQMIGEGTLGHALDLGVIALAASRGCLQL